MDAEDLEITPTKGEMDFQRPMPRLPRPLLLRDMSPALRALSLFLSR
jgi:hypothetical protein